MINIRKGKELVQLDSDRYWDDKPVDKTIQQICILTDKDIEWVESLPLSEAMALKETVDKIKISNKGNFNKVVNILNQEYRFIDLDSMSFGEWVDLDTFCKDPIENMESIITLLYRRPGESWDSSILKERKELFLENFPYEDAAGASLFFSLFVMDSIKITKDYSILDKMMKELMNMKELIQGLPSQPQKKKQRKKRKDNSSGS